MINGGIGSSVIAVEALDAYSFSNDCDQVINYATGNDTYYEVATTYVDAHVWKAIIVLKRS